MKLNKNTCMVIGANGMLGKRVVEYLKNKNKKVIEMAYKSCEKGQYHFDITCSNKIYFLINRFKPSIIYNCSGFTNVDLCETEFIKAMSINGWGPGSLSFICKKNNIFFVHISTDYIFGKKMDRALKPEDIPSPCNIYGKSKLGGEKLIKIFCEEWLIVRTSWLFDKEGRNFVNTVLSITKSKNEFSVVNDQIGCPTYVKDLARCIVDLAEKKLTGIYHFSNGPACSWYDFACHIVEKANIDCHIKPCTSEEFKSIAPRPQYSVLDCSKTFNKLNWEPPPWQDILSENYFKENKND